ncbi:esterase/lipase family protein [Paenibacillus chartarius]|uniref:Esterase/lipase family protein n=1 Tax=Paenibacillus chartarius TaxID=747481 RepID=A0ABV6DHB3_9BACL
MKKKAVFLLLSLLLMLSVAITPAYAAAPNPNLSKVPGTWAPGATPPNLNPNAPIVLFVQGLTSYAGMWYNESDMYQTAYNNGYQTAFVELYDSAGTPKSMWDNGKILADRIVEISKHYNKKIVVVAHSKGGVDTQTALVHYNAYPYVSNVITLSSPHYGSQLADLAYSSWAGWLAQLIGYQSDGAYSMQTSYMKYFRSITDSHVNASKNKFFTFAGNDWNAGTAAHFAGGLYLSFYGPNDGVVTVANSYIPKGTMVRVGAWSHQTIRNGSSTFSLFKPYLTTNTLALAPAAKDDGRAVAIAAADVESSARAEASAAEEASDVLVRGGSHNGQAVEKFLVENDVRSIKLTWMSDQQLSELELTDPDGKTRKVKVSAAQDQEGIFKGAWIHTAEVKKPKSGEWTVQATSERSGAYLLTVQYDSDLGRSLKLKPKKAGSNDKVQVEMKGLAAQQTKLRYSVSLAPAQDNKQKGKTRNLVVNETANAQDEIGLPSGHGSGVYNVTVDVAGQTPQGVPFERTLIRSIYEDEKGERY